MRKKYYVIFIIIVIGFIAGIWALRSKPPISPLSSPSGTVMTFYKALNKGDISRAEKCVSPDANLEDFLRTIAMSPRKYYREGWKSLAGKIQKVQIKGEQRGKVFGTDAAEVVIQVILKPGVKDQAKIKREEFIRTHPGYPFVGNFDDRVHREAAKYEFIANFSEKQICSLEKWDGKWKIVSIAGTR